MRATAESATSSVAALKSAVEAGCCGMRGVGTQLEDTLNSWAGKTARALEALDVSEKAWVSRIVTEGVGLSK